MYIQPRDRQKQQQHARLSLGYGILGLAGFLMCVGCYFNDTGMLSTSATLSTAATSTARFMHASSRPAFMGINNKANILRPVGCWATTSSNDFKNGLNIEMDQTPYKITEFMHVKPGKGSAFVRTKLKNLFTGNSVEKTFRAGESVEVADVYKSDVQYTYKDGDDFVFMDMTSFEEVRVGSGELGDSWKWMKEGETVGVVTYNGKVIDVELPKTVSLQVTRSDPGVKGNSATGASKPATLETGATIQVPLFIKENEYIKIDSRTGDYLSRDNDAKNK